MQRALGVLAALLTLTGCNEAMLPSDNGKSIKKWTDPETECVYLVYGAGTGNSTVGSLGIRFRRDGRPDCPGEREIPPEAELE